MIDNQLYLAAIHNLADVVIDNDEDYVEFSAANIDNIVELLNAATGFIGSHKYPAVVTESKPSCEEVSCDEAIEMLECLAGKVGDSR
jgi:hypothetical protein